MLARAGRKRHDMRILEGSASSRQSGKRKRDGEGVLRSMLLSKTVQYRNTTCESAFEQYLINASILHFYRCHSSDNDEHSRILDKWNALSFIQGC